MKSYSSMELIKILQNDGWYFLKATGSHHHFKHPSKKGKVTIPHPKKMFLTKLQKISYFKQKSNFNFPNTFKKQGVDTCEKGSIYIPYNIRLC